MIVSVPSSAFGEEPVTGASTKRDAALGQRRRRCAAPQARPDRRHVDAEQIRARAPFAAPLVAQQHRLDLGAVDDHRDHDGRSARADLGRRRGDLARRARRPSARAVSAVRFQTTSSKPARRRFAAMREPMMPRPMKPTGGSAIRRAAPRRTALSFCGSRSGGPWPKQTSAGSSAASLRADSRLRAGSGVKIAFGSWRPGMPVQHVHVVEHVAEHEHAVGLAPVGDVARRVARHVEHLEAGDLVALAQRAGRPCAAGPAQTRVEHAVDPVVRAGRSRRSPSRATSRSPHQSGMPSALADLLARALVVGVGVGERVRASPGGPWSCRRIRRPAWRVAASTSTSPIR